MTEGKQAGMFRWGIIGAGYAARKFVLGLRASDGGAPVLACSRTEANAAAFARDFGIANVRSSVEEAARSPDVDAFYIATPPSAHRHQAIACLSAGKAVLVEKPFTINAKEARELVGEARARRTFLMEAMWTRHLPHIVALREILAQGRLGAVRSVMADHGQWFTKNAAHRLFAPELGGGALLDLGVYPISFASMVLGTPSKVTAVSDQAFTGVDAQTGILLQYEGGQHAVLFTSLETRTPNWACVNGTEARIEIEGVFYAPSRFRLVTRDGDVEQFDFPHEGHGLRHQAATVGRCLRAGLTESDALPLDESIAIMETMDEIRRQIGLTYPSES